VALALIAAACGGDDADVGRPADEGQDGGRSNSLPCDPDCTLREAAAAAGISFGVHINGDNPEEHIQDLVVDDPVRDLVVREFDRITNLGVGMAPFQPRRGEYDFAVADAMYDFAAEHGLSTHAFHWLWSQDLLDLNPEWLEAITDPTEMWTALEDHLAAVVERYPDIDRINVVNEPMAVAGGALADNLFSSVLGRDYVAEAIRRADAIAPDYELFVNEVLVEYDQAKAEGYLDLVTGLVEDGVPVDGVGIQAHLFTGDPDWDVLQWLLEELDALGVRVAITELDAPVPKGLPDRFEVQAERMARVVELCLSVEACDSVILWGVHDGNSWLDDFMEPGLDPLVFTRELEPKPAYDAIRQVLLDHAR
jgi:endo-1,4-beta-xylanase